MSGGWRVLHLQVSDLGPLMLEPDEVGLYACFWQGPVPLGHRALLASELPLSSLQARQLAAGAIAPAVQAHLSRWCADEPVPETPLHRLAEVWRAAAGSMVQDTSLIICTRNRPAQLDRCLQSLSALAATPAEIVVVDNTTGDPATEQVVAAHPGVRYVIEPAPGLSHARNAGVRHSSGALIAFTDDDMVVTQEWLCELTQVFDRPEVAAASGLVLPAELRTEAQLLFERDFGGLSRGYEPKLYGTAFLSSLGSRAAPVWDICVGGNMAIRRSAFTRFGLFDERLGAGAAGCSEDSELWHRILAGAGVCAYVPTAVVHHYHRVDMQLVGSQIYFYMRGHVAALLIQFARSGQWRNLHRVFVELPIHSAEALLRWLLFRQPRHRVLLRGMLGSAAGVWYWLMHPRPR